MKTLIAYGTKYGSTEKCVNTLAKKLDGEVSLCNLTKIKAPNLLEYDNIIIGGSIYIGKIQKQVKKFCETNEEVLKTKKLGLFICCAEPEQSDLFINNAFPKALIDCAIVKMPFGGEVVFDKLYSFDRFLVKFRAKMTNSPIDMKKNVSTISDNAIKTFAEAINRLTY